MSLDSIAIATDGYVSRTVKKALIIAVAGYLNFGGGPTPPDDGGGNYGGVVGGGGYGYKIGKNHEETSWVEKRKSRIAKNEQEWMLLIKIYMEQCL